MNEIKKQAIRNIFKILAQISYEDFQEILQEDAEYIVTISRLCPISVETKVEMLLQQMDMPANLKGYKYLKMAITLVINDPEYKTGVTKKLYPYLANFFNTTAKGIEKSMHHAINAAWDRGCRDFLNSIFGNTIHPNKGTPTNTEFIAIVSKLLER